MDAAMSSSLPSFLSMRRKITKIVLYILSPTTNMTTIFRETRGLPTSTIAGASTHPPPAGDIEWLMKVLGLCFTALGAATQSLQYLQTTNQFTTMTLPPTYYLFSSTLYVALVALILSRFLPSAASHHLRSVLEQLGFFFAAVSFFAAITLIFPFWVKFTSWTLFIITILISIIVSCSFSHHNSPQSPSSNMHLPSEEDVRISRIDSTV